MREQHKSIFLNEYFANIHNITFYYTNIMYKDIWHFIIQILKYHYTDNYII